MGIYSHREHFPNKNIFQFTDGKILFQIKQDFKDSAKDLSAQLECILTEYAQRIQPKFRDNRESQVIFRVAFSRERR